MFAELRILKLMKQFFVTNWQQQIIILAIVLILCGFKFYSLFSQFALSGFTPLHYTDLKLFPENFVHNFPSGVETYDHSLYMQLYPFLASHFHILPELLVKIAIFIEYWSVLWVTIYVVKSLFPSSSVWEGLVVGLLMTTSSALQVSLANDGHVFFFGQFYNFAEIFRILGIIFLLQNRYCFSSFFINLSIWIHSIMGLLGACFSFGALLSKPKKLISIKNLVYFSSIMVGGVFWFYLIQVNSNVIGEGIPQEVWLSMTRMCNFHWYPIDIGFFTTDHSCFLMPFLAFTLLFFYYLPNTLREIDKKIVCGCSVLSILAIIGIMVPIWWPYPFLIKLALHRSMHLMSIFFLYYVSYGLLQDINKGTLFRSSLALSCLILPFIRGSEPYILVPSLFLAWPKIQKSFNIQNYNLRFFCLHILLIIITVTLFLLYYFGFIKGAKNYLGNFSFWVVFGIIISLNIAFSYSWKIKKLYQPLVLGISITVCVFIFQYSRLPSKKDLTQGENYRETQLWAQNHTKLQDVFMVDPTIYYGWRDFSKRSSFGNLREWVHVGWLYDSQKKTFEEGLKRFSFFNLPLEKYLNYNPIPLDGFYKMTGDVRSRFYTYSETWFLSLKKKYKIDYLVMKKKEIKRIYSFKKVFENDDFVIFQL